MGTEDEEDDPVGRAIATALSALSSASNVQEALGGVADALRSAEHDEDQSVAPPEPQGPTTDAIEEEARRKAMVKKKQDLLKIKADKIKKNFKPKPG